MFPVIPMIEPKPIKAAIAVVEKAIAKLDDTKARIPQLRAQADAAMVDVDADDKAAVRAIVEQRTTAEVLENQLPALEKRVDTAAAALLAELETQEQAYKGKLAAEESAYVVRLTTLLREYAPVVVQLNGERHDTALAAARACPVFHCFENRYPSVDSARNRTDRAESALACASEVLALYEAWLSNGKSFVPPNYGAERKAAA